MKKSLFLTVVSSLLVSKAFSECLFEPFGFSCCENESTSIDYTDEDADWGHENNKWCAIRKYCWSLSQHFPCCKKTTEVVLSDSTGHWGMEDGFWCGITPGGMHDVAKEYMSKFEIKNEIPDHINDKAEGVTIRSFTYSSDITESGRKLNVIFPPNFSTDKEYPVLYLLHGIDADETFYNDEKYGAINIPANLAKKGQAKEMLIVIPSEYAPLPGTHPEGLTQEHFDVYDNFINELLNNIKPFIEENFPVAKGRENTAIAGFSMGGRNALYIGYTRPDLFGYVAGFSPAWGVTPYEYYGMKGLFPTDKAFRIQEPVEYTPYVTLICTGTSDSIVLDFPYQYHNILTANQQDHLYIEVEGADHNEDAVTVGIYNFVSTLFGQLN
eukprot:jgi/Orpsp1_1/1186991/evm.model.d7180000054674.1